MPRKKTPISAAGATTGGVYLDDDEEFVEKTETTKTVGRHRRIPEREPEQDAPDADFIDVDDDGDEIEPPPFSQTSLAALVYGEDGEQAAEQFCTVAVRRKPDTMRDKFAVPCSAVTNLPRLSNVSLATEQADIEDQVRSEYGGGHYYFQIYFEGRLGRSWQATLADLPGWRPQPAETVQPQIITQPAPAKDPLDNFFDNLEKQQRMKNLLFGDEQKRFEDEIRDLRTKLEEAKAAVPPEQPVSEELLLWKMAREMPDSEAKSRLLDKLTPVDENGNRHWIADVLDLAIQNKDAIVGVLGSLFGGLMPQPAAQPSIADMLRQPAPAALPERKSVFNRHKAEPPADPAPAEMPPPAPTAAEPPTSADSDDLTKGDETAIDAEITNEVTNAKPKRNRNAAA